MAQRRVRDQPTGADEEAKPSLVGEVRLLLLVDLKVRTPRSTQHSVRCPEEGETNALVFFLRQISGIVISSVQHDQALQGEQLLFREKRTPRLFTQPDLAS